MRLIQWLGYRFTNTVRFSCIPDQKFFLMKDCVSSVADPWPFETIYCS